MAQTQNISPWADDTRSSMRLIAAGVHAAVEIKLNPGWKTYWRQPGDSGIPPVFDFSKSENADSVTVLWPAPHRFTDEGGASIGYKDNVVLPLRVTPRDAAKPVTLRLTLRYAVCEKLCVPAEGSTELLLGAAVPRDDAIAGVIARAEARVPLPAKVGDGGPLAVRAIKRVAGSPRANATVEVSAPPGASAELFAEGPTPDWALPVPMPQTAGAGGKASFTFELDGLPPGTDPNAAVPLTLTLTAGGRAIEVKTRLD